MIERHLLGVSALALMLGADRPLGARLQEAVHARADRPDAGAERALSRRSVVADPHGRGLPVRVAEAARRTRCGDTGVVTFIGSQDGVVHQQDPGPQAAEKAGVVASFNPDEGRVKADMTPP